MVVAIRRPLSSVVFVVLALCSISATLPAHGQGSLRGLRMIVVPTEEEAREIRERIQAGDASPAEMARPRSCDPSAQADGYLSVDPLGLRAEFRRALDGLDPAEMSRPTRIGNAWVLLGWVSPEEDAWRRRDGAGLEVAAPR